MRVLLRAEVERLAELADALAERAGETGQALGAEDEQGDDGDEGEMDRTLDAHGPRLAHASAIGGGRGATADPGLSLCGVASEAAPSTRRYPPPPDPEPFWPAQLTVLAAIGVQILLPARLTAGPEWLVPTMEGALLIGMFVVTPNVVEEEHPRRRRVALVLTALVSAANLFSLGELTHFLLHHQVSDGRSLIVSGVLIWLTNLLIFSLWFWEMDRGGPGKRAEGRDGPPDFLFPQMSDDAIEPRNWRPKFVDYLYVALTNNTAFSPTDTMPLTAMAKIVMGVQSTASFLTVGLIVSRAVNIL